MKPRHFLFLLFTASLCIASLFVFTRIYLAQQVGYGEALEVHKLQDKPEQYFVLDNPDQYVMRALSDPNSDVFVDLDKTQIDELIQSKGTNNFLFENSYYQVGSYPWIQHVLIFFWNFNYCIDCMGSSSYSDNNFPL
jgi:hypothetical protein